MSTELARPGAPVSGDRLQAILRSTGDLPPMPPVALKVNQIATDPGSSVADFRRIVEGDQALTARILRMANSAFYGLDHRVTTLTHAVVVLGFKTMQSLVVASASKGVYMGNGGKLDSTEQGFWDHSIGCAFACRLIAGEVRYPGVEPAFLGGLLHDVGKAVFNRTLRNEYDKVVERVHNTGAPYHEVEQESFGFTHAELGALLAQKWNLAPEHVEVIHDHHYGVNSSGSSYLLDIVRTANQLCHRLGIGCQANAGIDPLAGSRSADLGLDAEKLGRLGEKLVTTFDNERELF
jgi:putative nucleotidyltransferase with HDIG domain